MSYAALAQLPSVLWRWAVVCSSGQTDRRLVELPDWLKTLAQGELPPAALDWSDPAAVLALRQVIGELALPTLARHQPALALQILQSLLWHLDGLIDRPPTEDRAAAIERQAEAFRTSWVLQRQGWEEVLQLLPTLGDLAHARWDEVQGLLRRGEWAQAQRIGQRLERMDGLRRFIDQVGRRAAVPEAPPAASPRTEQAPATLQEPDDERRLPLPDEVDGVRRSRALARMTGAESAHLIHPGLRRLWRARFAEAQLLTYDDRSPAPRPQHRAPPLARSHRPLPAPAGRGPLIVCLDTSGSMRGAPENVAKACVLQALRSARAGERACRLLAFGAQGELLEHDLGAGPSGLNALLDTMGQSFDGGTDVQTPLERAVACVRDEAWRQADVLVVSDGEFGVTPQALSDLRAAKAELGLRVHGILIGDRETIGLLEVCDHLHWVRDWRRHADSAHGAGAEGFSPVHSQSLTALYFPNAIRR